MWNIGNAHAKMMAILHQWANIPCAAYTVCCWHVWWDQQVCLTLLTCQATSKPCINHWHCNAALVTSVLTCYRLSRRIDRKDENSQCIMTWQLVRCRMCQALSQASCTSLWKTSWSPATDLRTSRFRKQYLAKTEQWRNGINPIKNSA